MDQNGIPVVAGVLSTDRTGRLRNTVPRARASASSAHGGVTAVAGRRGSCMVVAHLERRVWNSAPGAKCLER